MIRNYLKIAWRNLVRNLGYSLINIGGLAIGMTVAILIALWVHDEVTYNQNFSNHKSIAQVVVRGENTSGPFVLRSTAPPFANEIRQLYGNNFKHVVMSSRPSREILTFGDQVISKTGYYFEPGVGDMLSLKMLTGSRHAIVSKEAILLSASTAKALFKDKDALNQQIRLDDNINLTVTGVYEDMPENTNFSDMSFIANWDLYVSNNPWIKRDDWRQNGFLTFVQLAEHADFESASNKIKNIRLDHASPEDAVLKFSVFLHPMDNWRLYSDLEHGGGRISIVILYATIGTFVLLLACINFMNLSTARSEKRAKEVGIRKSMGSFRSQLIYQFFSESFLIVAMGFLISLFLVKLLLPFFNEIAEKNITLLWTYPNFWLVALGFILMTGVISGSYPALYLSSFQPIKVLKGTFRAQGRSATLPRKILVVLQFTVSICLIVGVMVVNRQIQYAKDRPAGYNKDRLISVKVSTPEVHNHVEAIRNELIKSGYVNELAESLNPVTTVGFVLNGYDWIGTGPDLQSGFPTVYVSHEYGKTLGWEFIEGRDFSKEFASDTAALVLNETAVKYMGLKDPIGKTIRSTIFDKTKTFTVIGVIKDMLMESPYYAVRKTIYMLNKDGGNFINVRVSSGVDIQEAIAKMGSVFKKYNSEHPFEYSFVDEEFDRKFGEEETIRKVASMFAGLAIFISCLGILGLASFVAEQRTKEIGIRKVLGASAVRLWRMLSKDFVILVTISLLIAIPLSWYFMNNWLQQFEYKTDITMSIFAIAGCSALLITLATVSFQSIKAALTNPVKSLRSE
jgi:putative ABC transport system permease protein